LNLASCLGEGEEGEGGESEREGGRRGKGELEAPSEGGGMASDGRGSIRTMISGRRRGEEEVYRINIESQALEKDLVEESSSSSFSITRPSQSLLLTLNDISELSNFSGSSSLDEVDLDQRHAGEKRWSRSGELWRWREGGGERSTGQLSRVKRRRRSSRGQLL